MPKPIERGQRYMPGLDGLRAVAVLAVIAYHLGFGWAQGGLLGVGVFFTLSGYLITDLLLGRWHAGSMRLGNFWLRRARRLLPALFLMLAVVTAWVTLAQPSELPSLRGAVASASVYVNNWWLISQHISYFARFGPPSPLGHLWSLAIEEQFYLVWPFVLLLGLRFIRERPGLVRVRLRLAGVTLGLAAASAVLMALLYHPGFDSSRVYDGTDTRAFGLLFGAALAMVWPAHQLSAKITARARGLLDGLGTAGLIVIALLIWRTNQYSGFLYPIGLVLLSVATVLVLAALVHPATRLGRALGWRPLRWIGVRSYGIYLWHFPVIVLTTPALESGTVNIPRAALQTAATFVLAALSWRFVEDPIRRGALGRLWARARSGAWRPQGVSRPGWATLAAALAVLVLACFGLAGVSPVGRVSSLAASTPLDAVATQARPSARDASTGTALAPAQGGSPATSTSGSPPDGTAPAGAGSTETSCRSVVHIGDSTSEGLTSPDYLPNPHQRIPAQYARVGVTTVRPEISGATSIVETLPGETNAYDVARGLVGRGYRGCWVLALGTNDTADVYVGSSIALTTRIEQMMSAIGKQPVMWVNVKSLVSSGPYAEDNMLLWNSALTQECSRYPNMRVFDWASAVQDGWFIPDGIHYTSAGYAARGRLIARALAQAFPASGETSSSGCVVR
jgi:peptidoglycan/LPS O-acetylase OafA/YrhL